MAGSEDFVRVSLTFEEWGRLKEEVLDGRKYASRVSVYLIILLAHWRVQRGPFDAFVDAMDHLEGLRPISASPPGSQFKHPPLYPLWHKHYWTPRDIPRNLLIRWGLEDGGNSDWDRLMQEVMRDHGEAPDTWPDVLADRFVKGFNERARKGEEGRIKEVLPGEKRPRGLTGSWVIYGKHGGQNFYLGAAHHKEAEEDQEGLIKRLRDNTQMEFPFIF